MSLKEMSIRRREQHSLHSTSVSPADIAADNTSMYLVGHVLLLRHQHVSGRIVSP
jgi:hypothetical protein